MRFHQQQSQHQYNTNINNNNNNNSEWNDLILSSNGNTELDQTTRNIIYDPAKTNDAGITEIHLNEHDSQQNNKNWTHLTQTVNATLSNIKLAIQTPDTISKFHNCINIDDENVDNDDINEISRIDNLNQLNRNKLLLEQEQKTHMKYNSLGRCDTLSKLELDTNIIEEPRKDQSGESISDYSATSSDDSQLDDEEDNSSPSSSSYLSMHSPEQQNYPRGIINPNYPGFQHLAHTLSEHFIDHHQFENLSDSEISEDFDYDIQNNIINNNVTCRNNIIENDNGNSILTSSDGDIEEVKIRKHVNIIYDKFRRKQSFVAMETNDKLDDHFPIEENDIGDDFSANTTLDKNFNDDVSGVCHVAEEVQQDKIALNEFEMNYEIEHANNESEMEVEEEYASKDGAVDVITSPMHDDKEHIIFDSDHIPKQSEIDGLAKTILDITDDIKIQNLSTPDILLKHCSPTLCFIDSSENAQHNKNTLLGNDDTENELTKDIIDCFQPDLIKNIITKKASTHFDNEINLDVPDSSDIVADGANEYAADSSPKHNSNNTTVEYRPCRPHNVEIQSQIESDFQCITSSSTVDIIGEFGKEIEKEICLIVSGYRSSSDVNDVRMRRESADKDTDMNPINKNIDYNERMEVSQMEDKKENDLIKNLDEPYIFRKMTDAALSNGEETIAVSQNKDLDIEKCDWIEKEIIKFAPQTTTGSSDVALNSADGDTTAAVNKLRYSKHCESTLSGGKCEVKVLSGNLSKPALPTAIVKPKYQKSSYDERQLPPVGCILDSDDKPLYLANYLANNNNNNNNNNLINNYNTNARKYQMLPHFERKSKNTKINNNRKLIVNDVFVSRSDEGVFKRNDANGSIGLDVSSVSNKETINSYNLLNCEKDIDSTCSNSNENLNVKSINNNNNIKNNNSSIGSGSVAIVQPRKKEKMEINYYSIDKKCKSIINDNSNKINKNIHNNNNDNNNNNRNNNKINNNHNYLINSNNNNNNVSGQNDFTGTISRSSTTAAASASGSTANAKKRHESSASFDVYNIETALPVIDLEAIENHLRAAKEEERRRRNDREEIRRRLAMGAEDDYMKNIISEKPGRKPSLHSRLQNGMNLQICFMNETASDTESPSSDSETCPKLTKIRTNTTNSSGGHYKTNGHSSKTRSLTVSKPSVSSFGVNSNARPSSLALGPPVSEKTDVDFFTQQAKLQIEARMALSQAKDMAHMQMEIEKQRQKISPITAIIRNSLEKVGIQLAEDKRRVSRQMLTDMNIAQLQVIVNELHTQIENLNEQLVHYLMERDELHMGQDSMLVDIEDLTRYLGAKEQSKLKDKLPKPLQQQQNKPSLFPADPASASSSSIVSLAQVSPMSSNLVLGTSRSMETSTETTNSSILPAFSRSSSMTSNISTNQRSSTQSKLLRISSLVKK